MKNIEEIRNIVNTVLEEKSKKEWKDFKLILLGIILGSVSAWCVASMYFEVYN